ncbi:MAG TPA: CPBP family intramembrane glutamic endopeptidase [Vicinamibacterales bacterium]|nr:CPBP family intramembrane glutamic endopeptidase [Vicinamibacterales bacterium]
MRLRALLEVLICSGFPTQLFVIGVLWAAGLPARRPDGELSLLFVSVLSLADAALLISLVFVFLRAGHERARDVFLGARPVLGEATRGVLLVPVSFLVAIAVMAAVRAAAPWLHDVLVNPFEAIMRTTRERMVLLFVVIVAGGLREEIQRAFILHRFEQWLGGAWVGLVLFSVSFGLGHLAQGSDVAIATASLGAFWGVVYLRRRSVVAPAVAHAGFNASEILGAGIAG